MAKNAITHKHPDVSIIPNDSKCQDEENTELRGWIDSDPVDGN